MKHFLSSLLAAAFLWPGLATAQTVGVSVPDTSAPRGSEILLPVRVDSSLTGRNVTAFELQFQFGNQQLDPDSVIIAGTILDGSGWSIVMNRPSSNLLRIAGAGTTPLNGPGVLFYLRLKLNADGWTSFNFVDAAHNLLNQGDPAVITKNGSVNVVAPPAIGISPDGDVLAVGEHRTFTAYSGQAPYLWSTTDPAVATISSDGQLTALTRGSTYVVAQDATGLRDTTNQPVVVRAMGVGVPDTSVYVGTSFDLPVSITTLTGLGVTAGAFRLEFNGDLLTPTDVFTAGTVLLSVTPVVNMSVKGRLDVSFATAVPLNGSGPLFVVRFHAAAGTGWSALTFTQTLFNEDLPPKVRNGSVSLLSLSTIGLNVSSWSLIAGDTIQVTPGNGQAPFTWTTSDTTVARMDTMGHLIGLRSGIVRVIVRDALGAQGTSSEFQVFDGSVRIPNMVAVTGGWADVPVLLERLTPGNDISSFQMRLSYDSNYVRFDAVVTEGTLTGSWTPSFHSAPPVLTIAGATAGSLSATGVLLKLRFAVKPSLATGTQAGVRVDQLLFNEGLPFVDTENGIVTVAGVPAASSLWWPGDGWTGQPVTLQFQWNGVAYAETYHLQVATDTSFTTLVVNDSTLATASTWVGPLANGTVHYWRVRAKNSVGAGPWTPGWSFRTIATLAAAPILAGPPHEAQDLILTPTLQWHPSVRAVTYDIQVAEDSTFGTDVRLIGMVTDTAYTLGSLDHFRRYHWRVRAVNEAGAGDWSDAWSFETIIGTAAVPLLSDPAEGAVGIVLMPLLRWYRAEFALAYDLQVSEDALFSTTIVHATSIPDTSYPIGPLQPLHQYFWRVRSLNNVDSSAYSPAWQFTTDVSGGVMVDGGAVPSEFGLDRNYPNPFNPGTRIGFRLAEEAWVTLTIYSLRGSEVDRVVNERLPAGSYHMWWNASRLPSGVYICRMVAGRFTSAQRMVLLK